MLDAANKRKNSDSSKNKMIEFYLTAESTDRARIFSILNEQEKRRLFALESQKIDSLNQTFENELQDLYKAITDHLAVDSTERQFAMNMYNEIKDCWSSKRDLVKTKMTDTYLLEAVRRTKALVETSPASNEFIARSEAFTRTMKDIRNEGALNAIACAGSTLVALMLLAGAALIIAATFGAFSEPFRVGLQTISAIGAGATASTSYLPWMFAADQYSKARDKLTFASKMSDLGDAMTARRHRPS